MAGTAGEVVIGVNADTGKLVGQLKGLGSIFDSVLGANILSNPINAALTGIMDKVDAAVARVDTLNKFPQVMQTMGFAAEDAEASIDKLKDGVTGLPTALDDIVSTTQNLAVLTGDLEGATDTALALNNAFLASGASSADASRGLVQYSQMLAKGTVDMASWRTLQETMGFALKETAEAFGFAGDAAVNDFYEALQKGEITFAEFNSKLIELSAAEGGFADMAQESTSGIATSMSNAETAVVRGVANIIDSFDQMYGVQNMIATGGSAVEAVLNGIADNLNVIIPLVIGIGATVAIWKLSSAGADTFRSSSESLSQTLARVDGDASKLTMTLTRHSAEAKNAANAELQAIAKEKQAEAERKKNIATIKQKTAATKQATAAKKELAAAAAKEKAEQAKETAAQKQGAEADKAAADAAQLAAEADELQAQADEAAEQAKQALKDAADALGESEAADAAAVTAETDAQNENTQAVSMGQVVLGMMNGSLKLHEGATLMAKSAVEKLSAAWAANPIGLIVTIVTAAVTAFKAFAEAVSTSTEESRALKEESEQLAESTEKARNEAEKGAVNYEYQAERASQLISQMDGLIGRTDLTAQEQGLLSASVRMLNDLYGEWDLTLDENNNILDKTSEQTFKSKEAMEEYAASIRKSAEAESYYRLLQQATDRAAEAQTKLTIATEDLMGRLSELNPDATEDELSKMFDEAVSGAETLRDNLESLPPIISDIGQNLINGATIFWEDGEAKDYIETILNCRDAMEDATAEADIYQTTIKNLAKATQEAAEAENTATAEAEKAAQIRDELAQTMTKEGETVEDLAAKWGVSTDQIIDEASQLEGDASEKLDAWAQATQEAYDKAYAAMEERGAAIISKNDEIINSFEKLETNANGISFDKGMSTWEDNIQKQNEFEQAMLEFAEVATPQAVAQMRELGISHADWLQEMLKSPEALAQFEELVKQSMQSAADSAERESQRISEDIQAAFNAANIAAGFEIDEMGQIVDTKTGKIVEDVSKQKELWGNVGGELGTEMIQKITTGVEETTPESTAAVEETMTEAHTAAQSKANDGSWQTVGNQISKGIAQGIRSGSSYVTEAVRQIISSALAAAQSAAEIHSPSKLFARVIGENIPEGIAKGIEMNIDAIRKPIKELRKFAYTDAADVPAIATTTLVHEAYNELNLSGLNAQNALLQRQIDATNALLNKDWGISVDGRQLAIATNAANAAMGARTYKGSIGDKY